MDTQPADRMAVRRQKNCCGGDGRSNDQAVTAPLRSKGDMARRLQRMIPDLLFGQFIRMLPEIIIHIIDSLLNRRGQYFQIDPLSGGRTAEQKTKQVQESPVTGPDFRRFPV